jgi:eukaryotic-like serine/threonine-protein kinase
VVAPGDGSEPESSVWARLAELTPSTELGSMASMLVELASTNEPVVLTPGTLVADQYRIERTIAAGGMGVVFLAHDIRLGRPVAVKLCTGLSSSAVHRIQREAMALAKLAHPNVVVVFQAGELDGRFFIAMEYVAGGTARSWLAAAPRSPREIIALYLHAGTGLAAAHAEGLIHRDFKPDNVLVGHDGRPRVADFGLVWTTREELRDPNVDTASGPAGLITQAGLVLGTIAYMPPEQLAGADIDARADQYAFAASLWEALFGQRPNAGDSAPATREQAPGVPRHVVTALRRALSEDPAHRWDDVDALLVELRRDPAATRRRALIGVGALGLTAALAGFAVAGTHEPIALPCEDAAARIQPVWSDERRAALATAVGEPAWSGIEQRADARATAWMDAHAQACRATQLEGVASEDVLYRRMLCLQGRLDQLDTMIDALSSGSPAATARAAEALDALPSSASCLDAAATAEEEPPPRDPLRREAIAAAQRAIAEAEAAVFDPIRLDAPGKTEHAVELAQATEWTPVTIHALHVLAELAYGEERYEDTLKAYRESIRLALVTGSDSAAVTEMSSSAWSMSDTDRYGEAALVLATARALWERVGQPAALLHQILGAEAHLALREGRPQDALVATRAQIVAVEEALGTPTSSVATNQYNLAIALLAAGENDQAAVAAARSIALAIDALGEEHPKVADYRLMAAEISIKRGELEAARELATPALRAHERWFGGDDLRVAHAVNLLGVIAQRQGRNDEAIPLFQRQLALRRAQDPESAEIPEIQTNLAVVAAQQGDFATAVPLAAQALAELERHRGTDSSSLVPALVLTGYLARERPERDLALSERDLLRARALAEKSLGADHGDTINVDIELATTDLAAGKPAAAIARLEPSLARIDALEVPLTQPLELRFVLARALSATGATARACTLADEAEQGYRGLQLDAEPVAQWRAQHCAGKPASAP